MVFNATFNNISGISWHSVLLVEETGVTRENHRPVESHWQTLSHIAVSSTLVVIRTDCTGSWKANYHTITTNPEILFKKRQHHIWIIKCILFWTSSNLILSLHQLFRQNHALYFAQIRRWSKIKISIPFVHWTNMEFHNQITIIVPWIILNLVYLYLFNGNTNSEGVYRAFYQYFFFFISTDYYWCQQKLFAWPVE